MAIITFTASQQNKQPIKINLIIKNPNLNLKKTTNKI
jgi:hypothetical protein